jgi:aspartate/methionine/tyrosine aminotransferase
MLAEYTERRNLFLGFLKKAGMNFIEPQGAYYVLLDISPFGFKDDYAFCEWMVREIGVAATPGSYFFHEPVKNYIRLNFAKSEETLNEAGERLQRLQEIG